MAERGNSFNLIELIKNEFMKNAGNGNNIIKGLNELKKVSWAYFEKIMSLKNFKCWKARKSC